MRDVNPLTTQVAQHVASGVRVDRYVEGQFRSYPNNRHVANPVRSASGFTVARCGGDDHHVMASCDLPFGQTEHLGFDSSRARSETVGDVGDPHQATVRHAGNGVRHNASVRTLVFCHAHPDDEALLTAGTMAKATAAGHRVVLVMATDGSAGMAGSSFGDLAATRRQELADSAQILGVHRVVNLGYADSGLHGEAENGFASIPVGEVAEQIAQVIEEENADILVGYDPSGGYGHPDHLHVHRVAREAARVGGSRLFEATLPREPIAQAVHAAALLRLTPQGFDPREFDQAWTPRAQITHRVNVRDHLAAKRAAQAAHASQASSDDGVRTLQVLGRLPSPLARLLLGTEFYVEVRSSTTADASFGSS